MLDYFGRLSILNTKNGKKNFLSIFSHFLLEYRIIRVLPMSFLNKELAILLSRCYWG